MSWVQKLYETYEACAGNEPDGSELLLPVCHTMQQAHIEIVLDEKGTFKRSRVLEKSESTTVIPCTENSSGRTGSKPVNHPLCDKLQYLAGDFLDFGGEVTSGFASDPTVPYQMYLSLLTAWAESSFGHPKLNAIREYVSRKTLIKDLVKAGVLHVDTNGKLLKEWMGEKVDSPRIFTVLPNGYQKDAFVRWSVEVPSNPCSETHADRDLILAWIGYSDSIQTKRGFCMVSGVESALAVQHPSKIRHAADKAKLISANETNGFLTFSGRFLGADELAGVSSLLSQKAHSALRWLISKQGYRSGDQAIVAWSVAGKKIPDPFSDFSELFGIAADDVAASTRVGAGQSYGIKLRNAIAGFRANLQSNDDVVVMGLSSATPGRMAICYYRELKGSEFLERIQTWHDLYAWPQNFGSKKKFIGAPAPRDIAEAAYGRKLDDKLKAATVERLLPCIIEEIPMPRDLVESTTRRACQRIGMEHWEWEKCLGIACALVRGFYKERKYRMALENDRTTRDYLYGRMLAIAERMEGLALFIAGEKRETMAARLMQRFADRPYSTWRTIELSLTPYKARLRSQRSGFLIKMEKLLDEVISSFRSASDFNNDGALAGEFLLGYHSQRYDLIAMPEATENEMTES